MCFCILEYRRLWENTKKKPIVKVKKSTSGLFTLYQILRDLSLPRSLPQQLSDGHRAYKWCRHATQDWTFINHSLISNRKIRFRLWFYPIRTLKSMLVHAFEKSKGSGIIFFVKYSNAHEPHWRIEFRSINGAGHLTVIFRSVPLSLTLMGKTHFQRYLAIETQSL